MWSAKPGSVVVHFVCQCVTEAGLALIDMHAIPKPSKNMQPLFTQQQPPPKNSLLSAIVKPSTSKKEFLNVFFSSYKECVSCLSYICKKDHTIALESRAKLYISWKVILGTKRKKGLPPHLLYISFKLCLFTIYHMA